MISKLAFESVGIYRQQFSSTTPEFGTDGSYSKCVTKDLHGNLVMYKRGSEGFANSGLEPYCEFLSSELYSIITDGRSVKCDLEKLHDRVASRCSIFTDEHLGLIPYHLLSPLPGLSALKFYDEFGCGDLFRAMLVADAVCLNEGRHVGNYGMLFDNDTMELVRMAPIYDNNVSLLPYAMESDFSDIDSYLKEHNTRLGSDWVTVAKNALTPRLRSILINLKGYAFRYNGCEKFPRERVKRLERLVNRQINSILG